jgi:hypothetical protein
LVFIAALYGGEMKNFLKSTLGLVAIGVLGSLLSTSEILAQTGESKEWVINCGQLAYRDKVTGAVTEIVGARQEWERGTSGFLIRLEKTTGMMDTQNRSQSWTLNRGEIVSRESNGDYLKMYTVSSGELFETVGFIFRNDRPFSMIQNAKRVDYMGRCRVIR